MISFFAITKKLSGSWRLLNDNNNKIILNGVEWDTIQIMHSGECVGTMRRTLRLCDALRCAASSQRHKLYTVHYFFYKTGLNFHSLQDLKMCVNTAFDMAASRENIRSCNPSASCSIKFSV